MTKHLILFVLLVLIWIALFFIQPAYAFAPETKREIPTALQSNPVKAYAYDQVSMRWGEEAWESFNNIITRESRWNSASQNNHSSAFGLPQFLDSTWRALGLEKTSDPYLQIDAAIIYIEDRYQKPEIAWQYWQNNKFY